MNLFPAKKANKSAMILFQLNNVLDALINVIESIWLFIKLLRFTFIYILFFGRFPIIKYLTVLDI